MTENVTPPSTAPVTPGVFLTKEKHDILMRIVKHSQKLEQCVARSALNQNHPKFLLAKALKEFEDVSRPI